MHINTETSAEVTSQQENTQARVFDMSMENGQSSYMKMKDIVRKFLGLYSLLGDYSDLRARFEANPTPYLTTGGDISDLSVPSETQSFLEYVNGVGMTIPHDALVKLDPTVAYPIVYLKLKDYSDEQNHNRDRSYYDNHMPSESDPDNCMVIHEGALTVNMEANIQNIGKADGLAGVLKGDLQNSLLGYQREGVTVKKSEEWETAYHVVSNIHRSYQDYFAVIRMPYLIAQYDIYGEIKFANTSTEMEPEAIILTST